MGRKLTTEQFIERARKVHGDKYDYSKAEYVDCRTKVCITCRLHGDFFSLPDNHTQGKGCPRCGRISTSNKKKYTTETFIRKAKEIHGDKYDYTKVEYINSITEIIIICPIHGAFLQRPADHLSGHGCRKCAKRELDKELFVSKSKVYHGDKYDYSKVDYIDCKSKVCVICPVHGEFFVTPSNHMRGRGCPKCSGHYKRTNKEFIEDARKVHGNKYDYSKCNFITVNDKVCIVCPMHGEFWQKPSEHLSGHGCFICGNSLKGDYARLTTEEFIRKARKIHGDKYNYSKAEYVDAQTKVCIVCPIHGEFWQTPNSHLGGQGCPKCGHEKRALSQRSTLDYVLAKFAATHGEEYDYSLVEYKGDSKKVKIICSKHGVFEQTPSHHAQGNGCPRCSSSKGEKKIRAFLQEHNIMFVDQYKITTKITLWGKDECLRVDFFIPDKNLIIEFNGLQHYQMVDFFHSSDNGFEKQRARDKKLKKWCKDNNVNLLVIKYDQIDNIDRILKNKLLNKNGNEND